MWVCDAQQDKRRAHGLARVSKVAIAWTIRVGEPKIAVMAENDGVPPLQSALMGAPLSLMQSPRVWIRWTSPR
jgi:hypothetical protein